MVISNPLKLQKLNDPSLTFNRTSVTQSKIQKHSGMFLDSKLDFKEHIQNMFNKIRKTIGLLCKFHKILKRPSIITIYESFVSLHLDYGDIIYDQAYKCCLSSKTGVHLVQSHAGNNRGRDGISTEQLYHELSFESFERTRWCCKLCCFHKTFKI